MAKRNRAATNVDESVDSASAAATLGVRQRSLKKLFALCDEALDGLKDGSEPGSETWQLRYGAKASRMDVTRMIAGLFCDLLEMERSLTPKAAQEQDAAPPLSRDEAERLALWLNNRLAREG